MNGIGFPQLLRYNQQEAERWRAWFEKQSPAVLEVPVGSADVGMENVKGMLSHIFLVEWGYSQMVQGRGFEGWEKLKRETVEDLFAIGETARRELHAVIERAGPESLDEVLSISGKIAVTRPDGTTETRDINLSGSRRKMLAHTFLHSIRHWAQVATAVRQAGYPTDWGHDFIFTDALP